MYHKTFIKRVTFYKIAYAMTCITESESQEFHVSSYITLVLVMMQQGVLP